MAKKGAKNKAAATKTTGTTATATVSEPVIVRISSAGVVLDPVAHVMNGQDVKWVAQDGEGPWTVTFGTSPFTRKTYKVPRGGSKETTGGADGTVGKRYGYTVMDETGQITDKDAAVVII
jgi:hypothetical protein